MDRVKGSWRFTAQLLQISGSGDAMSDRRDIKDVIGVLMRVSDGAEVSHEELDDLGFEADDELEIALNEAYLKLREFANDRDLRLNDPALDHSMRSELKNCLDNIVKCCGI